MGKKNLEQLFKDTFQDFQEVPDEKVWKSIEASLDKKKQRKRVIPIWWQLGGIAAALAILFLVINPFDAVQGTDQIISETENTANPESSNDADTNGNAIVAPTNNQVQGTLAGSSEEERISNTVPSNSVANNTAVAKIEKEENGNEDEGRASLIANAQDDKEVLTLADNGTQTERNQTKLLQEDISGTKNAIAENTLDQNQAVADHLNQEKESEEAVVLNEEQNPSTEKKSIYDAIKEQELEEEVLAQGTAQKWSVGPSVAPVYYSASGNGSPIHSDFSTNSKSGNLNLSYGLTVGYEIGKKLKLRSGVHKVNYGYDTNDVVFSSTLRASTNDQFANIDYSQNSQTIVVQSKRTADSQNALSKEVALNSAPVLDGKMVQQLGYIEVPLELNYALLDKKFGVDLIGGVSSLFLIDNSVLLESDNLVTEMGEANNVNSLNFSANVGMGLNYEFAPKLQLNIEPVLKYQLNTFSKTAGDFRPYSIGVYSGIIFKF